MARGSSLRKRGRQNSRNGEEESSEQRRRAAGRAAARSYEKPQPINWLAVVVLGGLLIGGGGTVAVKAFQGMMRFMEPTYEVLDAGNTKFLQNVLFDGEPWVVFCGKKTHDGRVNNTYQGRTSISSVQLMDKLAVQAKGRFRVGLLDCLRPLPSGKNIFERFKLKPSSISSQIAFWVANGNKPKLLDAYSLRSTVDYDVGRLATRVASLTELKATPITNTKQLTKRCVESKRGCVLIIQKGQSLPENAKGELNKLMKANRRLRYASLDITKRKISLTLPPAMMGYPQVVLIRKSAVGEGVDRYYEYTYSIFDDEFESKEVEKFISQGIKLTPKDKFWSILEPLPRISKIITQSPPKPKSKKASKPKKKPKSSTAKAKTTAGKSAAQKKKAAEPEPPKESDEEMYKRRRKQMDDDMRENAPQAHEDEPYDDEIELEDEEEEEVIDLDD
ncbi:hypothetical protein AAMO2058_001498200 [Amorphochlora amoebiformis]